MARLTASPLSSLGSNLFSNALQFVHKTRISNQSHKKIRKKFRDKHLFGIV